MAVTEISIADARVDQRISVGPDGPLEPGVFLVREITPLDAETFAVVLQSTAGGPDVEATVPADLTVGLVGEP